MAFTSKSRFKIKHGRHLMCTPRKCKAFIPHVSIWTNHHLLLLTLTNFFTSLHTYNVRRNRDKTQYCCLYWYTFSMPKLCKNFSLSHFGQHSLACSRKVFIAVISKTIGYIPKTFTVHTHVIQLSASLCFITFEDK